MGGLGGHTDRMKNVSSLNKTIYSFYNYIIVYLNFYATTRLGVLPDQIWLCPDMPWQ